LETGFILFLLLRKITKNLSPGAFLELKMLPNWIQRALILRGGKEKGRGWGEGEAESHAVTHFHF